MQSRKYLGQKDLLSKYEEERENKTKKIIQKTRENESNNESETEELKFFPKNYLQKAYYKKKDPLSFSLIQQKKEKQLQSPIYAEKEEKSIKLKERESFTRFKNKESSRKMDVFDEIQKLKNIVKSHDQQYKAQEERYKKQLNYIQQENEQKSKAQEERYKRQLNYIQQENENYKRQLNYILIKNEQNSKAAEESYKMQLKIFQQNSKTKEEKYLNQLKAIQINLKVLRKEVDELKEFHFSAKLRKLLKNLLEYIIRHFSPDYTEYDFKTKRIYFKNAPKIPKNLTSTKKDIIDALNRILELLFSKSKEKDYKIHFISKQALENKTFKKNLRVFESSKHFFDFFQISSNDQAILKILISESYFIFIDNVKFEVSIKELMNKVEEEYKKKILASKK